MSPDIQQSVLDFQKLVGAHRPTRIATIPMSSSEALDIKIASENLIEASRLFKRLYLGNPSNQLLLRVELMLEEMGEVLEGISERNEVKILDGLVDTVYVVVGTATTLKLPFSEAFVEVHNSNMTKSPAAANHAGDKGKGPGFKPANISQFVK